MKREIKFKIWDMKRKRFVNSHIPDPESNYGLRADGKLVQFGVTHTYQPFFEWEEHPEEVELLQYTGLKDKNGKEIYESDILNRNGFRYKIIYGIAGFMFRGIEVRHSGYFYSKESTEFEIIGNIYENPELIK